VTGHSIKEAIMMNSSHEKCLCSYEFASFLAGTVYGSERARMRRHLNGCNHCFEIYISTFNQSFDDWARQSPAFVFTPAYAYS
jgi:hypothetical protein